MTGNGLDARGVYSAHQGNYFGPVFRWFAPYRVKAVDLGRFDGAPGIHVRKRFKKEKHHERRKQENRKDREGRKAGSEGSEADRVVGAGAGQGRGRRQQGLRFPFEHQEQLENAAATTTGKCCGAPRGSVIDQHRAAGAGDGASLRLAPFLHDPHPPRTRRSKLSNRRAPCDTVSIRSSLSSSAASAVASCSGGPYPMRVVVARRRSARKVANAR